MPLPELVFIYELTDKNQEIKWPVEGGKTQNKNMTKIKETHNKKKTKE